MYSFYAWLHWSSKEVIFEILLNECPKEPPKGRFLWFRRKYWRWRHKTQRCCHIYYTGAWDLAGCAPYFPTGKMECTDRGALLRAMVENDPNARISLMQGRYDFLIKEEKRGKRFQKWREKYKNKASTADKTK